MATKNYMINDKWLDLDKQNIVELQSVDGVLDSLKVNGSEIETPSGKITITENGTDIDIAQYALADVAVEGGSSDFSTAEVEVTNNMSKAGFTITLPHIEEDGLYSVLTVNPTAAVVVYVPLYQGKCVAYSDQAGGLVYTGDITRTGTDIFITGDGTITVNP